MDGAAHADSDCAFAAYAADTADAYADVCATGYADGYADAYRPEAYADADPRSDA